jgi:hypothetical protein
LPIGIRMGVAPERFSPNIKPVATKKPENRPGNIAPVQAIMPMAPATRIR